MSVCASTYNSVRSSNSRNRNVNKFISTESEVSSKRRTAKDLIAFGNFCCIFWKRCFGHALINKSSCCLGELIIIYHIIQTFELSHFSAEVLMMNDLTTIALA